MRLLTCLTFMVNNSNVVSNTTCNSQFDYNHTVLSVLLQVEQTGGTSATSKRLFDITLLVEV